MLPLKTVLHFFKKIASLLAEKGMISIGGDFNCILERELDRLLKARPLGMMEELGLVYIWYSHHPKDRDLTFMSQVHRSYSRLFWHFKNRYIQSTGQ